MKRIKNGLNVVSLFDGMSCGQIALKESKIRVNKYYASEIDKFAMQVTQHNFPNTIQLGDVTKVKVKDLPKIDLLIGGSPCQGFSFAGNGLNFDDPRSILFFEYIKILKELKEINPDIKFLLENVNMKRKHLGVINTFMEIFPVRINSNLVSAQNRDRFYWTNIKTKKVGLFQQLWSDIPQPTDRYILLKDIIENGYIDRNKSHCLDANYFKGTNLSQYLSKSRRQIVYLTDKEIKRGEIKHKPQIFKSGNRNGKVNFPTKIDGKDKTLCTIIIKGGRELNHIEDLKGIRMLTVIECSKLQTIPDWYSWKGCSDSQIYKMLGNGWTIDIIKHIFSYL